MPPTAFAGPDQTAFSTNTVEIGESGLPTTIGSPCDLDTDERSGGYVAQPSSVSPTHFVAPTVTADTLLTFNTDGNGRRRCDSSSDSVNVTVQPIPPTVTIRVARSHV